MEQLILTYITVLSAIVVAAHKVFSYFKNLNRTDCGGCSSDCSTCASADLLKNIKIEMK